jgi:hypothetical protein
VDGGISMTQMRQAPKLLRWSRANAPGKPVPRAARESKKGQIICIIYICFAIVTGA